MLLAEEFVLLTLDGDSGKKTLSGGRYGPALGAALLVELALMERISVAPHSAGWRQRGRVSVTSTKPTDDTELDAVLEVIEAKEGVKIGSLISDMARKPITKGLHERLLERLVRAGVVRQARSDVLGLRRVDGGSVAGGGPASVAVVSGGGGAADRANGGVGLVAAGDREPGHGRPAGGCGGQEGRRRAGQGAQ